MNKDPENFNEEYFNRYREYFNRYGNLVTDFTQYHFYKLTEYIQKFIDENKEDTTSDFHLCSITIYSFLSSLIELEFNSVKEIFGKKAAAPICMMHINGLISRIKRLQEELPEEPNLKKDIDK